MTGFSFHFSRYLKITQKYGIWGAFRNGWRKLTSHFSLQIRARWQSLQATRMPSDQKFMRQTIGKWNCLEDLITYLRMKRSPAFLFSTKDREEYIELLQRNYEANVENTLSVAARICQHQFRFLGEDFNFGGEIDWHLDPKSELRWPMDYFEKIDSWMWSRNRLGDYKLPWELNRHQYFIVLGKAYWLTGDERYAEEFTNQITSWIRSNPEGMGINWYSSLEIGIRLISWVLAFHFFRDNKYFMEEAGKTFLKNLYQQAKFLRHHLTLDWKVRNNHILGEVAALIFVSCLFPEFKEASEWLHTGLRIFEDEIQRQTYPDGVNKEQATSYHRFVLDFLLLIIILSRRGVMQTSPIFEEVAEKMLNYVMHLSSLDGDVPMIGDADDGRGYILDEGANFRDFRESLAVGAVLFQRPDFKFVAQDFTEGAFWLLGSEGLQAFDHMKCITPNETSVSFPHGGIYILRETWTPDSDYALFKCGTFGLGGDGFCAHGHCDLLSVVLRIKGISILVDTGTFTYHGPWRNFFRLTESHNTLTVDGRGQAIPINEFAWRDIPQAKCVEWDGARVKGNMVSAVGVQHQRELVHPKPGVWMVNDKLDGEGIHSLSWHFHFAPNLELRWIDSTNELLIELSNRSHVLVVPPDGVKSRIEYSWYSSNYGEKQPNPHLVATWNGEIPPEGLFFHWEFRYVGEV